MKAKIIMILVKFLLGAIALGLGIWYLSSSIGGDALTYTSMGNFMTAIGAGDNVANTNGCFFCRYVTDLFGVLGRATELFWDAIVNYLWLLMAIGFGVFLFTYTGQYIYDAAKKTATLDTKEKKLELKAWFDKVWRQGVRILVAGAFLGTLGLGGTTALKYVAKITITPVMFVGAELGMAASGVSDSTHCGAMETVEETNDILNPVLQPFMCSIGNLNAVTLAGAAGGFSLMNYAWLGMGGGAITWIAGLALVIMFLIIGFDLFFQVLGVVFKLIFLIIFMPLFIAAYAFEPVWKAASGLVTRAIEMLVSSAVKIVAISLKIVIIYATVSYAADAFFPGPVDGFSTILPPMMNQAVQNPDAKTLSVMNTFSECERVALADGEMDADKFKNCFTAHRATVERRYPGAFDFMGDGWGFMMLMIGLFALYYWVISPKIDTLLASTKDGDDTFDFGTNIKQLGKNIWNIPVQLTEKITSALGKK
ncbi:MAG: hypothetical protein IJ866_01850 [Alphaproteobacteria bacterium]|nr:hypothetical protein [Alphaproteobacteria bacterium]